MLGRLIHLTMALLLAIPACANALDGREASTDRCEKDAALVLAAVRDTAGLLGDAGTAAAKTRQIIEVGEMLTGSLFSMQSRCISNPRFRHHLAEAAQVLGAAECKAGAIVPGRAHLALAFMIAQPQPGDDEATRKSLAEIAQHSGDLAEEACKPAPPEAPQTNP